MMKGEVIKLVCSDIQAAIHHRSTVNWVEFITLISLLSSVISTLNLSVLGATFLIIITSLILHQSEKALLFFSDAYREGHHEGKYISICTALQLPVTDEEEGLSHLVIVHNLEKKA
jgi:hypothetical protein